jgi:tetratricopeptide (TPR) repeat protein
MQNAVTTSPLLARAQRLIESDSYEQAAQVLISHLRKNPQDTRALSQIGFVAMRLGALGQAEQFLRKAIACGARDFEVRRNLASVMSQQDRSGQAIPMFEALVQESDDPGLKAILAGLLEKLGRNEESRALYQQLIKEKPKLPPMWIAYGHCLRSAGDVEGAIAAYRKAIEVDYEFGEAWWGLASIKSKVFDEADIAEMRRALDIAIDPRNQAPLNFAIARALHDRREYESAFRHYEEGNRLRAESLKYNPDELSEEIDEVERTVDSAFFGRLTDTPLGDDHPVFIVSLPRSGSTLLEQMLGSHPSIEPVGELPYIPAILRSFMELVTRRGKITVPQAIRQLSDEKAAAFGRDYLLRASLHSKTDRPFFVDKLPHNWNNILFIRRILPHAKFIDIRRPAMDCCFSNFTQSFTSAHPSSFALRDVGRSYLDNVRLMEHLDRVAPGLVHHVDYRTLVEEPQTELRSVLDYLGLPWDETVLDFHRLDRVVRTPSSEQVRRPLNRDGMEIWRPYSQWLDPLREVLGDLAQA